MIRASHILSAIAVTTALVAPASAATIIAGTGTSNNGFPFTFNATGTTTPTYQQVYNSTLFGSSSSAITGLAFTLASGGTVAGGTFTFSLSTTSKAVNALDTTVYTNNIGANNTVVYVGTLASLLSGSTMALNFAPFIFDPAAGNLLLNITATGFTGGSGGFKANSGDSAGAFSRVTNMGIGTTNSGLQTTFTTAVPEPGAWAMMIAGFALLGAMLRDEKRARKAKVRVRFS